MIIAVDARMYRHESKGGNMKIKSKRKILMIALSVMAVLITVGDWVLSVEIYNENFNQRFESY